MNCMPVFIAREKYGRGASEEPASVIGDDIKSQVGATIHAC